MAVANNKKMKLLFLLDILRKNTDENHIISMKEILSKLEMEGISAERKSIYADIETLKEYGFDIEMRKNPTGYMLASREFELPELKLLVDSVQASKFLSEKKSNELIKKLESMTSKYESNELQRQVYVADRVKTTNEGIFYNVDKIHKAILGNSKIAYKYLEWNEKKELVAKKQGKEYIVSPISLVWSDENYYLVAYSEEDAKIKHYRVDKMKDILVTKLQRDIPKDAKNFNLAKFSKGTFGMYGGDEVSVDLLFSKSLIGVMIDRFGNNIPIIPKGDNCYKTIVNVVKSGQFFGWLTGLGKDVKLIGPQNVVDEYKDYLNSIVENYL